MVQKISWRSRWRAKANALALRNGAVVACPAEGVWGLSCDPFNEQAVKRLLIIKQRPIDKGLIIVGSAVNMFDKTLEHLGSNETKKLLDSWPGPNTWLVPNKGIFPEWITGASGDVAIRVSSSPALVALCSAFEGPLVSTSANPSGHPPALHLSDIRRYFGPGLPVMPGKVNPDGKASTIRRISDGALLRQ